MGSFNALNGLLSFLQKSPQKAPNGTRVFQRPERASFISTKRFEVGEKLTDVFQRPERASFISTSLEEGWKNQTEIMFQRPERASFISTLI